VGARPRDDEGVSPVRRQEAAAGDRSPAAVSARYGGAVTATGARGAGAAPARQTLAVLERQLVLFRRVWRGSVFSSLILPVLFLLSMGIGVGGYVGELEGAPYLQWIVPGLLSMTAFEIALVESTYPVMSDFKWTRAYFAISATPVGVAGILQGWLLYLVLRVVLAVAVFLVVAAGFGGLASPWAVVAPLVCTVLTLAVAAPVTAFAAVVDSDSYFALLFRFAMVPSSLFGGVFFPVERLPAAAQAAAQATPLWHAVELNRAATLGIPPAWPVAAHLAYLAVWGGVGCVLAAVAFRRRLYR